MPCFDLLWFDLTSFPDSFSPELAAGLSIYARGGWLQNEDGSWSGRRGLPGSVEETALAVEALAGEESSHTAVISGVNWLAKQLGQGRIEEAAPIGFYFAKLWYFERLYPLIFATSALRRVSYFNANAAVKAEFDA